MGKKSFYEWCIENDKKEWIDLWDYDLSRFSPKDVSYSSREYAYFKCEKGIHDSTRIRVEHLSRRKNDNLCTGCRSFGQFLVDKFGDSAIENYWSQKNEINPFEAPRTGKGEVWIKCINKRHEDFKTTFGTFVNTSGCPICSNRRVLSGVNDIGTLGNEILKYIYNEKDKTSLGCYSNKKVKMICPDCGNIKLMSPNDFMTRGFSCNKCGDGFSYPNKFMFNMLEQLDVEFVTEYSPSWIKPKRYDFYLPEYKLIIEMDGGLHYRDGFGADFKDVTDADSIKDKKAIENDNYVIRIDCNYANMRERFEYILNKIHNSCLSNIFDISNIDFFKCDAYCNTNIMKSACNLWDSKEFDNLYDIANHLNIRYCTVWNYLKAGNKIGICVFDETCISNFKNGNVDVYWNNEYLGEFRNFKTIKKLAKDKYDTAISNTSFYRHLSSRECYKGFIFLRKTL